MADTVAEQMLAKAAITGLDISGAMGRMGNSAKLYLRIIHTFVEKMPGNLDELATELLTAERLPDYAIKIHGAKGSCYGIGGAVAGDLAKELEIAAKAGNLQTCLQKNDHFLETVRTLIEELLCMEAQIAQAELEGNPKAQAPVPDATQLTALLAATQSYDIEQMTTLIEQLSSIEYLSGGSVVAQTKAAIEAFNYQAAEEALRAYLSGSN